MKIRRHSESHIVELYDGSTWRIFPGDMDVTLNWKPETDLKLIHIADEISSHALINLGDNSRVRVIFAAENWPVKEVGRRLGMVNAAEFRVILTGGWPPYEALATSIGSPRGDTSCICGPALRLLANHASSQGCAN